MGIRSIGVLLLLVFSNLVYGQTLPSQVAFSPEQIVQEKVNKVNRQNGGVDSPEVTVSLFKSSESSQGLNLSSALKTQKIGLDLNTEGETLRKDVLQQQLDAGETDPQGCADTATLNTYQSNMCLAADSLQVMAVETASTQSHFQVTAEASYHTMEDTSAYILNNSNSVYFAADSNGIPTSSNILYQENKKAIEDFKKVLTALDSNSEYKGLKFNTKKDYFYLDGKKYPSSILYSKEAMLKAGIKKTIADFVYSMLGKKSKLAQDRIAKLLKQKGLYDGKDWKIVQYSGDINSDPSDSVGRNSTDQEIPPNTVSPAPGEVSLSSSLVEEETLYKQVNGISLGLSSDDIFKMISRRYRESDRRGFFHNSPKK